MVNLQWTRRTALCLCLAFGSLPSSPPLVHISDTLYPVARDGKWGFINAQGRIVLPLRFDEARPFSDGLARVVLADTIGFIDSTGRILFHAPYEYVAEFSNGFAVVNVGVERDRHSGLPIKPGRWGYLDRTGKLAIPMRFTHADDFSEGLAAVDFDTVSGFIDTAGRMVFQFPYDMSWGFHDGFALVRAVEGMFYLDRTGRPLTTPPIDQYEAHSFTEGLAAVGLDEKWGFIDTTGRLVIERRFEDASDFSEGVAAVRFPPDSGSGFRCERKDGSSYASRSNWGYINRNGNEVIAPLAEGADPFASGLAAVEKCGRVHYINRAGAIVFTTGFETGGAFEDSLAIVSQQAESGLSWGYIDRRGRVIWPPSR